MHVNDNSCSPPTTVSDVCVWQLTSYSKHTVACCVGMQRWRRGGTAHTGWLGWRGCLRPPGIDPPAAKRGLRDRNSPTCTLSQNGYGTSGSGLFGITCGKKRRLAWPTWQRMHPVHIASGHHGHKSAAASPSRHSVHFITHQSVVSC